MCRRFAQIGFGAILGFQLLFAGACASASKLPPATASRSVSVEDADLKRRDLAAQESMARSAEWQLGLSWLTLLGVAATVIYTRKQIQDNRRQMAAFVVETGSTFHIQEGYATKITVGLMNRGGTAALDFCAWGSSGIYPADASLPRAPSYRPDVTTAAVGPGQDRAVPIVGPEFLSAEQVRRISMGFDVFAAQVTGSYTDVFGRKQIIHVNLKTEVVTTGVPRLIFY